MSSLSSSDYSISSLGRLISTAATSGKGKSVAAAIACASLLSAVLVPFFFPREGSVPESFPLQNTIRIWWANDTILDFILHWTRFMQEKHGKDTFLLKPVGLPQFVFTNNVENVKHILKDNFDNYVKGPQMKYRFQGLLGDGIFNADGALWKMHRKTSAYLFNMNKFRGVVLDTFNEHATVVMQWLERSIGSKKGIDFQGLMFRYTLDSIGKIAFGQDIGALHSEGGVQFADDFDYVQEMTNQSFLDPFWWFKRYLSPAGWQYFACLKRINTYAYAMVQKVRKEGEQAIGSKAASEASKTLIGLYLERQTDGPSQSQSISSLNDKESSDASAEMGTLTDTDLRDIIMNFIIAGRDTTAQSLSWTFYRLSIHPEIQVAARNEVFSVLTASNTNTTIDRSAWISFDQLKEMRYLDALCKEVLRFHPSVPKEAKHAWKDDTLPDGTKVKASDLVIFCPWIMGRSESIWEDCQTFNPERFLGDKNTKPSPFQFTAFQAGPRVCLGQDLALLEMKCCIARLLLNFEFSLAQTKESVTYLNTLTLPIKNGLHLHVKPLV